MKKLILVLLLFGGLAVLISRRKRQPAPGQKVEPIAPAWWASSPRPNGTMFSEAQLRALQEVRNRIYALDPSDRFAMKPPQEW